jgi:HD-GYP domain-containing protein (c-di-GMP phosphodiesterase class II)
MTSNSAINIILENKEGKFDKQVLTTFLHRSSIYKIGQPIFIPGEGRGTIIGFSNYVEAPNKPIVTFINGSTKDYYSNT